MAAEIGTEIGIIALLVVINAFFACAEIAIVSVDRTWLQQLLDKGDKAAQAVERLTEDTTRMLATIQVGVTFAAFFTSANAAVGLSVPLALALEPFLGEVSTNAAFILVTLGVSVLSLVLGELFPKKIALLYPERIALFVAPPLEWLSKIGSPFVKLLSFLTNILLRATGNPIHNADRAVTTDQIKTMIEFARDSGEVNEQERKMLFGVVELGDLSVRTLMVPRVQIVAIEAQQSLIAARELAGQTDYTRLPVFDKVIDNIIGILHTKDLLREWRPELGDAQKVKELLRAVTFIPESKSASELLREMQRDRRHMAIVCDEYGGTVGLVTLEDLLEEIVGEIRDEYDVEEEQEFKRLGPQSGVFKLHAHLAVVNNELDLELPRDDHVTVGGLLHQYLQRPPLPGDSVTVPDSEVIVTVLESRQVRIERLVSVADET
ncbi:hemolysin family protein [Candidatus Cyanaurora vandensis]|uniref:hemolysin family protein n=1 Tax=Candidatus Cyanaurora vandensis TaxID=2714958 RepID=UPI00257A64D6|nr:hemolysin family protein [Candidatus Cyanaurora vandensis]